MPIDVRTAHDDDRETLHRLSQQAFAEQPAAYDPEAEQTKTPLDRRLVATDGSTIAGALSVWELGQWFGASRVPTGGVAGVVVEPAFRGRGVASALLGSAVRAMHDRGEALATLYPMNHGLYRRHGWELGGSYPEHDIPLQHLTELPKPERRVALRTATHDDLPRLRELHANASQDEPGNLWYGPQFAARTLLSWPPNHPGGQDAYVAEVDGVITGGVSLNHTAARDTTELYSLIVRQLIAEDLDTELALWGLLGAHYPVARTVRMVAPMRQLLPHLLTERGIRPAGAGMCWMTRLIDAAAAFQTRGYPEHVQAEIPLEITDPLAPWNAGRHVLRIREGKGTLDPGGTGRLQVQIGTLASLFTGWADPRLLAGWGRLTGAERTDLEGLRAGLYGRTPWSGDFF